MLEEELAMSDVLPCVVRPVHPGRGSLGDPRLDAYVEFVAARARPNTVLATWFDLKVFFTVVGKPVDEVRAVDVLGFISAQRAGLARLPDPLPGPVVGVVEGSGVSVRTIRRRLSTINGLYAFLRVRGDVDTNPVPRGLPTRREKARPSQGVPLLRSARTLPRILSPGQVDALTGALRTHRDRAMVAAMLLGGLRRCEVLGLRLVDVRAGDRQLFVADGKGGHQRLVPVSPRFFEHVGAYLDIERPADTASDALFLVLKRPHRGRPLSAKGLEQVLASARERAGLQHGSCHELRHTCLTRLREAGMALEAVQAQAGHASIESTRIYLHLADDWLASQYRRAAEVIDAQVYAGPTAASPRPPDPDPLDRVPIAGFRRLR
ncbi:tyrosine-type recombinase/integrase [uncultured Serinicoccus sp.]|uniref:tyrosine-type recombinase/integrase n=1 Tax=uncultured Serinicoccus sp. TaxID=735514 RepID=UPI002613DA44|nr:tyrosine-type recombinase/integrase [uncultured Serinicoccus sp.]